MTDFSQIRIQPVNFLVALIISLFIVFPDVARHLETRSFDTTGMQRQQRPIPHFENKDRKSSPEQENRPSPDFHFSPGQRPNRTPMDNINKIVFDFFFFFSLSLLLLFFNSWILTDKKRFLLTEKRVVLITILTDLSFCILFAGAYSLMQNGLFNYNFPGPHFFNGMLLFKCFFVGIVSGLFGYISRLIYKQHHMAIENERLHSENLQNRFDALTAQINPHFFFNSLNSLSSLVRDKKYKNSLKYINELSDIFRYVLKSNWKELVPLSDEINFLNAYRYMLEIRFENKLSFDIIVDEASKNKFSLPVLSLQPVIENVVKHNIISEEYPMQIRIVVTDDNMLAISNPIQRKIDIEQGTGIGLDNLDKRYRLLVEKGIEIIKDGKIFTIRLPLKY